MYDQRLKDRLLREVNLKLEKAIDTSRATETAKAQVQAMGATNQERAVQRQKVSEHWSKGRKQSPKHSQNKQWTKNNACSKCGKLHQPQQCPAYGAACNKCGKLNHYEKVCRSHKTQPNKKVHKLDDGIDALFLGTVDID